MASPQSKPPVPATMTVFLEGPTESFDLVDTKDWAVIFEDVLEVRSKDAGTHYFSLAAVKKWVVR